MTELVEKRMQEPKDDLISTLVVEQVKPGHLEQADAVQMAFLLLVAGNATMVNMITLVSGAPNMLFTWGRRMMYHFSTVQIVDN